MTLPLKTWMQQNQFKKTFFKFWKLETELTKPVSATQLIIKEESF